MPALIHKHSFLEAKMNNRVFNNLNFYANIAKCVKFAAREFSCHAVKTFPIYV